MTIKILLDTLREDDRRLLEFCLEADIANYLVLPDGRYIGVYCDRIPNLDSPEMEAGNWRVGRIKNDHQR